VDEIDQYLDTALYPDIIAAGGLGPALRASGADLGDVHVPASINGFWNVSVPAGRGQVMVTMGSAERAFVVTILDTTHTWASGTTTVLPEVVAVASAWRGGVTLAGLHERFPFMTYGPQAQAYEDGNPVEVAWAELVRSHRGTPLQPLIEAARADPRLSRLMPSTTHDRVVRCHLDESGREVRITSTAAGYEVTTTFDDSSEVVSGAAAAVEAAAARAGG
jgi:hypothetical protein